MENKVEIYIITKTGILLHKYSILSIKQEQKDQLMSGFLTAINSFAKEIGFPTDVSLIRSGNLEARFYSGKYVFSVIIIDYSMPLGLMTEPILSGLAEELCHLFERTYRAELELGNDTNIYKDSDYESFHSHIVETINKYAKETGELYHKLILIEAIYSKVPQKWILPLMEKAGSEFDIVEGLRAIPKIYRSELRNAIDKVSLTSMPLWKIFAIETIASDQLY